MIKLEGIKLGYGERVLLEGVTVELRPGRLVAMLGRNGAGKSTLIRAFCRLERLQEGRILVGPAGGLAAVAGGFPATPGGGSDSARDVATLSRNDLARLVSFVGTDRVRVPNLRARELVSLGRAPHTGPFGRLTARDRQIVSRALDLVGMSAYADRPLDTLSDGECQRIVIARALAQDTPVMLLDEPTAWLDIPGRRQTVALLHDLASSQGKTIIFSTHDLDLAMKYADDFLLFDPPHLLTDPAAIPRLFGL